MNENLDRLSSSGFYSFTSVLDSIVDTIEKYRTSNVCYEAPPEIDDHDDDVDRESRYSMAVSTVDFYQNKGSLKNSYFEQLIDEANKICDGARSMACMSARTEVPCSNENIKNDILRWCKVYSPCHNGRCVGFEIELTRILSGYYRQGHGHVFEELGFSFATPLLIEVNFQPLSGSWGCFNIRSLQSQQSQQKSLSKAFQGVLAVHGDGEFKISSSEGNFVYDDGDLDGHP